MFEDEMIFEDDFFGDDIVFEGDVFDDVSGGVFFSDDVLFNGMFVFVMLFFVIVIGIFLFFIFKGISMWSKNEQFFCFFVKVKIMDKWINVYCYGGYVYEYYYFYMFIIYYVIFQFESIDCFEFIVLGCEYGMLVEGDEGMLMF